MIKSAAEPVDNSASSSATSTTAYYLLKAEPDSRIVKGKDVKFSVEDFEKVKTSPWEGVRNFEARNIMKEMKIGDKALFYHSNCKNPGVAAFAEVSKEAYPDYTAWDEKHPYFDPKTDKNNPKWFMVDLSVVSRPKHFVPLALLKYISTLRTDDIPSEIEYLGKEDVEAIKGMDLVTRGRLSVQRVRKPEWDAIHTLADGGGWEEWDLKKMQAGSSRTGPKGKAVAKRKRGTDEDENDTKPEAPAKKTQKSKVVARRNKKAAGSEQSRSESPLTELEDEPTGEKQPTKARPKPRTPSVPQEGTRRSTRRKATS